MKLYCTHGACRLDAMMELMWMSQRLRRPELLKAMATCQAQSVPCRIAMRENNQKYGLFAPVPKLQ